MRSRRDISASPPISTLSLIFNGHHRKFASLSLFVKPLSRQPHQAALLDLPQAPVPCGRTVPAQVSDRFIGRAHEQCIKIFIAR